jgi:hypothetical protein
VLFLGLLCHSAHFQLAATSIRGIEEGHPKEKTGKKKISKECFASLETIKKSIAHTQQQDKEKGEIQQKLK